MKYFLLAGTALWFCVGLYFSETLLGTEQGIYAMGSFIISSVWFVGHVIVTELRGH